MGVVGLGVMVEPLKQILFTMTPDPMTSPLPTKSPTSAREPRGERRWTHFVGGGMGIGIVSWWSSSRLPLATVGQGEEEIHHKIPRIPIAIGKRAEVGQCDGLLLSSHYVPALFLFFP